MTPRSHSHAICNRLAAIKNTADLLLLEETAPDRRHLLSLIKERALSALDLEEIFTLSESLRAREYLAFPKEQPIGEILQSLQATLADAGGRASVEPDRESTTIKEATWRGDENLLLLLVRSVARMLTPPDGQAQLRVAVSLRNGGLCLRIAAAKASPRPMRLDEGLSEIRAIVSSVGGNLGLSSGGLGAEIRLPSVTAGQKEVPLETAFSHSG